MSGKFSKHMRSICIEITEALMSLPCGQPFLYPSETDNPKIVKHPIGLETIHSRLNDNEYTSISQWEKDVCLIWTNVEKYNTKNSYMYYMAAELQNHFNKLFQMKIKNRRLAKWSRTVYTLKTKLEALFSEIPPLIGAFSVQPEMIQGKDVKLFSEEELNVFIRMSLFLHNKEDSKKLAMIIKHFQPNVEIGKGDIEIDVNDLEKQTLHSLRNYVELRLAEMNISYPK